MTLEQVRGLYGVNKALITQKNSKNKRKIKESFQKLNAF